MNRELPFYLLGALMIHGSVLWAWASVPTSLIGTREPPAVEIEMEEQSLEETEPSSEAPAALREMPPPHAEKMTQPLQNPVPNPEAVIPEPIAEVSPTPQAAPLSRPHNPCLAPVKTSSTHQPVSGRSSGAKAKTGSGATVGSPLDRSHASWKHRVTPSYPASALLERKAGRVMVTVQVNALGQPTAAMVTGSSGNAVLDAAAARAARQSTYYPKCVLGVPLQDTVSIPYNFDIQRR